MEEKISVGISNRHVHLNKEIYDMLFDEEMEMVRPLNQIGEFVSNQVVSICIGEKEISNVKVLGPLRDYNQVEISRKDALKLGICPPVRASGDLSGALEVTLKTNKASVKVSACILAQRHVHMPASLANKLGVNDKQKVQIKLEGDRSGIVDAFVKISENAFFEAHLDTDDACAFILDNNSKGTLII